MVQSPLDQDPPNPPWNHRIPHEKPNCCSWRGKLWHLTEIWHSWLWSFTLDEILHFLIQSFPIFTIFHLNFLAVLHACLFSFKSLHRVKPSNEGITRIWDPLDSHIENPYSGNPRVLGLYPTQNSHLPRGREISHCKACSLPCKQGGCHTVAVPLH